MRTLSGNLIAAMRGMCRIHCLDDGTMAGHVYTVNCIEIPVQNSKGMAAEVIICSIA